MQAKYPIYCFLEADGCSGIGVADLKDISFEVLTEADKLKQQMDGYLAGIVVTDNNIGQRSLRQLSSFSLDCIHHYKYGGEICLMDVHGSIVRSLTDGKGPFMVLTGATSTGRSIANDIASRSDVVYLSNCLEINRKNGCFEVTRPIVNGQIYSRHKVASDRCLVISIKAGAIGYLKTGKSTAYGNIKEIDLSAQRMERASERGLIKGDHRTVDLGEADIVVGVGTGVIDSGCLDDVLAFADEIKATCGCTRPLVDAGVFPMNRQIGITGKAISPRIYVALGISGTDHHVKGIMNSRNIVAVNKDRDAPIFNVADAGFVGDIKRLMPYVKQSLDKLRRNADA